MKIYISSTTKDLSDYRRTVIEAVLRSGHTVDCMEYHAAGDIVPKDKCLQDVSSCDIYVGIFAWRYGHIPRQCEVSITEMEYRKAKECGIPTLIFLTDENIEWPAKFRDDDINSQRIEKLRNELKETKWMRPFTSPDNLAAEVLSAIMRIVFVGTQDPQSKDEEIQQDELVRLQMKQAEEERRRRLQNKESAPISVHEKLVRYFQDRETEMSELQQCMANKNLRMVLICGRGGVGKTSLTAKLVNELNENSREGSDSCKCIVVSLGDSEYRSPDQIVNSLERIMDLDAAAELREVWNKQGAPLRERLAALFRGPLSHHRYLIILDNLESVLDDGNRIHVEFSALRQFIEACLEYDHASLIIATSRRTLSLASDVEIATMGRRVQISLDKGLPEKYAVALMRELDCDGRLGIRNSPDDTLGNVARRCQFIPRTLETLVSTLLQKPTWTLATLLANDSFLVKLIENPARELFSSLSSDQERLVMQALALYDKPVPSAAIRAILPALPIDELLDKFVCNFVASHDSGLFWLHPLDRMYAYGQIPEQGSDYSKPALHKMAAEFYRKLRKPAEQWRTIEDVEPQMSEFHHLVQAKAYDEACRILNEIDREYLSTWGYTQQIKEMRSQIVGQIEDSQLRGLNLGHLGSAYLDTGDATRAKEFYKQALEIARETSIRANECRWLGNLGLAHHSLGEHEQASKLLSVALDIAKAMNDRIHENRWLGNLTQVLLNLKQITEQQAIENYLQAIAIARDVSDRRFEMVWSERLGNFHIRIGELSKAKEQLHSALTASKRIGARLSTCRIQVQLGELYGRLGETSQQAEYFELACEGLGATQNPADRANVLIKLASIYLDLGQRQKQIECYDKALQIAQEIGDKTAERNLYLTLGDVCAQWDREKTVDYYRSALDIAKEMADPDNEIIVLLRLASISTEVGQIEEIAKYYEQALQIARQVRNHTSEAIILCQYANAMLNMGEARGAIMYYELALPMLRDMNDKPSQSHILNRLGMAAYFLKDVIKAIRYYEQNLLISREIKDRDSEAIALFNIGDAYHLADDVTKAVPFYEDSLILNMSSTNYKCALGLGIAFLQMGKQNDAKKHFAHCIRILMDNPLSNLAFHPQMAALGVSLLAVGRTQEGLELYKHGLKLSPHKESLYYAIQDLQLLQRVRIPIAGLDEAIDILEMAFNVRSEDNI